MACTLKKNILVIVSFLSLQQIFFYALWMKEDLFWKFHEFCYAFIQSLTPQNLNEQANTSIFLMCAIVAVGNFILYDVYLKQNCTRMTSVDVKTLPCYNRLLSNYLYSRRQVKYILLVFLTLPPVFLMDSKYSDTGTSWLCFFWNPIIIYLFGFLTRLRSWEIINLGTPPLRIVCVVLIVLSGNILTMFVYMLCFPFLYYWVSNSIRSFIRLPCDNSLVAR